MTSFLCSVAINQDCEEKVFTEPSLCKKTLRMSLLLASHQFLEEVPDPLVVAPLLDAGQKSVVELPVNLVELRHFEEDGFYLGHSEHGLRRRGCSLQRLHGLKIAETTH